MKRRDLLKIAGLAIPGMTWLIKRTKSEELHPQYKFFIRAIMVECLWGPWGTRARLCELMPSCLGICAEHWPHNERKVQFPLCDAPELRKYIGTKRWYQLERRDDEWWISSEGVFLTENK